MSSKHWSDSVSEIAATLTVAGCKSAGPWTHWLIRHKPGAAGTFTAGDSYVSLGPGILTITGDLGSMVFERPGGLSVHFGQHRDLGYIAQKCTAGEVFDYSIDQALRDIEAHIDDSIAEMLESPALLDHVFDSLEEAEFLELHDCHAVRRWYNETLNGGGDWSDIGRVPSSDLLRAFACLAVVIKAGEENATTCDHHDQTRVLGAEVLTFECWRCSARATVLTGHWTVGTNGEVEGCMCM